MAGNFTLPSTDVVVEKLSIPLLIFYFVLYVVLHVIIGYVQKKAAAEVAADPNNKDLVTKLKVFNFLFKWFPAIYVVLIIIIL